jgi:hypothetical protein
MESTVRAAQPGEPEEAEKYETQDESLDLSAEQIEERASVKTTVLIDILEREEWSHWRHGGLNE